jgi:hypothetical protein
VRRHHAGNTWTGLYNPQFRRPKTSSILLLYLLLMFADVNVQLDRLPHWMSTLAQALPVTHGAKAARELVAGTPSATSRPCSQQKPSSLSSTGLAASLPEMRERSLLWPATRMTPHRQCSTTPAGRLDQTDSLANRA